MACDITLGRKEPCKDSVGGIKAVYFINYGDITGLAYDDTDTDVIDDLGALTAYKYELKGANSLEETANTSRENGTNFWEQVVTAILKKKDAQTNKEMKLLAYGRPHIVVEDYNGTAVIVGLEHGAEVAVNTSTGAAMGDLNGYTITATAQERVPANFLKDAVKDNPFAGLGSTVTVVEGT
jgi:hypothetical protein